ncbi:EG45-like domain containing protein [Silene latifolia]|uniref:EG45-like domain containing protein n=1 Tax=Silene latifolia TaxID=37657 RepID=UPI003D77F97F
MREQFVPEHIQHKMRSEFESFTMTEEMTVTEYYHRFLELSRYVEDMQLGQRGVALRFERGLSAKIMNRLPAGVATDLKEVYLRAASACYGNTPEGTMIAAAGDQLWNGGKICGTMFRVTCTGPTNPFPHPCNQGKSVLVKIVDQCPNCGGTIDLSKEAFSTIANPVAGIIKIDYVK